MRSFSGGLALGLGVAVLLAFGCCGTPVLIFTLLPKNPSAPTAGTTKAVEQKPKNTDAENLDVFRRLIAGRPYVRTVSASGFYATITVDNDWHRQPKQIRLQHAQWLQQRWVAALGVDDGDKARIKVVDLQGNEVGGSRIVGGSLIWVDE